MNGIKLSNYDFVDLSQEIFTGAPVFPGHPETKITSVDTYESILNSGRFTEGYCYFSEKLEISTHGTTHVDSISHIDPRPGAMNIDEIPLNYFITPAICLDLTNNPPKTYYSVGMIKCALEKDSLDIRKGDTVLLNSGHYLRYYGKSQWLTEYSGLNKESAEYIYGKGVINIGQDAPSHDCVLTTSYPAHQVCKEMQTMNIENLGDLSKVSGRRFIFIGLPLKIRNGSGSPIRAVALLEKNKK